MTAVPGRFGRLTARVARSAAWVSLRATRSLLLMTAALLVVLVAAAATVYLGYVRPENRLDQARTEGLAAARLRTEQVLSFAPRTLDADLRRAGDSVTGAFAAEFRGLLEQLVKPTVQAGLATKTTVIRAGLVAAEDDRVTVLLFLNQDASGPGTPAKTTRSRAQVTVERVAGQWLIADLRNL